ncbi:4Fe-4S binding domain-containing protein [Desulfatibacillum alkenivorans DSM 16219]|jgi:Pyruvate/2-oxoacid:ferredoxin oxidoreductase delta subunit|uniref:4Fe-4S binding domain-containing protein n=1 Tax=Desulfatibacillum alkenivorans DSM 16219 TaxID=1121393 RepID=A0A1M6ECQ6_9BACT|nr:4Fe-4S binding protein [Desulfatibacillum alkenivorans]SHI83221.1 4Fe-4S binding domain-containing protein [Desulfatibacillum alkenivorans DSM 16219]
MALRKIIEIDEEKCDGCGQCILSCAEGALEIVDGKAKLVGDILCDGLGACLGECPQDALHLIEREAPEFDEEAVHERMARMKSDAPKPAAGFGCPSSQAMIMTMPPQGDPGEAGASTLGHWPVKLQLMGPNTPFLKGADLVLLADCAAASNPALHQKVLPGKAIAMGCPKLDDLQAHIDKLAQILAGAKPKSLTVMFMDVPCCKGFVYAAQKAVEKAGVDMPIGLIQIGRNGDVLMEGTLDKDGKLS